jgi:hypothetical protein
MVGSILDVPLQQLLATFMSCTHHTSAAHRCVLRVLQGWSARSVLQICVFDLCRRRQGWQCMAWLLAGASCK